MPTEAKSLVFQEAVDYHRNKLAMPTKTWTDIWRMQHGRAFVVAGANTEDLVTGFHEAIGKAIAEGQSITKFRKEFDRLVAEHGWSYNGKRGWRSRVIYDTNLSQAHSAGRWEQAKQLDDPVGRYVHTASEHERPEHKAKHGVTLPLSHTMWRTWWPINGWGCHCTVDVLSAASAKARGWQISDDPAPDKMVTKTINTPAGPKSVTLPKGIDPGFDYNPGEAAFGHKLNDDVMSAWRKKGRGAWDQLTPGDWQSADRPERVPADKPLAKLGPPAKSKAELARAVETAIGGKERVFELPDGSRVLVDALALAKHIDLARASFIPFLPELLQNPFEIWQSFERHQGTGKVEIRKRLVKVIDLGGDRSLTLVAQASKGRFEAWTFVPSDRPQQLGRSRVGKLLYGRKNGK